VIVRRVSRPTTAAANLRVGCTTGAPVAAAIAAGPIAAALNLGAPTAVGRGIVRRMHLMPISLSSRFTAPYSRRVAACALFFSLAPICVAQQHAPPAELPAPRARPGGAWPDFLRMAAERHGDLGARAAAFLAEHAPERDAGLSLELLADNLSLALAARTRFPWAAAVPEDVFLNDVLPYAVLDETREAWRPKLLDVAAPLVAGATSLGEAAQALNRGVFNAVGVHYDTGRKFPNQSPFESMAQSRATCTGLSIVLVDACRAVGVPARIAGVASWHDKRGNHTWVEIFDGTRWRFLGADEYDPAGLDRGWFAGDASQAVAGDEQFAVWATSWRRTGAHFPLVWSPEDQSVPAVDVTPRYAAAAAPVTADAADAAVASAASFAPAASGAHAAQAAQTSQAGAAAKPALAAAHALAVRHVRVLSQAGGERLLAALVVRDAAGSEVARDSSRAGRADLNDMPEFRLAPGEYVLELTVSGETRSVTLDAREAGASTLEVDWSTARKAATRIVAADVSATGAATSAAVNAAGLSRDTAESLVQELWLARRAELLPQLAAELQAQAIASGGQVLRLLSKRFGDAPEGRRSLWISLHGGGGAPPEVNDQQWANQVRLYEPAEGFYVAPRAPGDSWDLWHQGRVDPLLQRLIDAYVVVNGVDPDRVYLLGYSAGGDGVYQLAPRLADRFAAASMMAGHPNEAQPLGLRNLPFALFVGGKDAAYGRNEVTAQWGARLDELAAADPGGYVHRLTIYPEDGHWMGGKDREGLPWMAARTRDAWPTRLVWFQDNVVHERFYWLAVPAEQAVAGRTIRATVTGQEIAIEAPDAKSLALRLRDGLVDLDQPITVRLGERVVFTGLVPRTREAIEASLAERADPRSAATAWLVIEP